MARTTANIVMEAEKRIPAPAPRTRGSKWTAVFEQIQGRRQPVKVAVFDSANGAGNLRRRIAQGIITVPGGVDSWEIVTRSEIGEGGERTGRSELHARWLGG